MSSSERPDAVVILDFGGQYSHLIARRVREMMVYSVTLPCHSTKADIEKLNDTAQVKGIVLSGSPASVRMDKSPMLDDGVLEIGLPILGLCYGHQLIAHMFGGDVGRGEIREYGVTKAKIDKPAGLLEGVDPEERVWMSHGDTVFSVPEKFEVLAHTDASPVAAYMHKSKPLYGLQWHPEVVHTEKGGEMLKNFVFKICGCRPNWKPANIVEQALGEIERTVGGSKAIIALSGGVDSSVAAALAAKALGSRLVAVHIDHGFMRIKESDAVKQAFRGLGIDLIVVKAQDRFMERLQGASDPEEKRKIIGEEFIRVFEAEARKTGAEFLIQGTIYPDRIESGFRKHSDKIKTHHNVGGLPLKMEFKAVVEPLRDLYKDEVRKLGASLGLPKTILKRQPFPGPGLAVRIVGEVNKERLKIIRQADAIVCEEVESKLHEVVWQYLAVLTNTKSTGVKGDEREYGATIAVRIVESVDGMTANFSKAPWPILERISTRITNEISEVTRVVYDITNKPPATIEWE